MAALAASAFAAMTSAATSIAGATSGALSTLSGVTTALSMASTVLGGFAAYRQSSDQAKWSQIEARGDMLAAEARAVEIRRELVKSIGQNRVAFAASGLDISSGGAIEASLEGQADFEAGKALSSGRMARAGHVGQAAGYRARGASSLIGAAARAAGQYADYKIDISRRG